MASLCSQVIADTLPRLGESSIEEVIAALTLEEKVGLVMGTGMDDIPGLPAERRGPAIGSNSKARVPGAAGTTLAIPRLGIPAIILADGPAGVRINPLREEEDGSFHATAFPIATLLASTWDTALVEQVGESMGLEAKEYGVDVLLAPALNIHRIPLGGRNFEYYSEDPLLSGEMAAAMINGVQSNGVGTSIKHFVANNHEWNRNVIDVKVGSRTLHEIYYKGFEIAVKKSAPWTVMSSYNKLNGVYTSESHDLLTKTLRESWGFEGLVMTDWFGGQDPAAQLQAGNDLLMPGMETQYLELLSALKSGQLQETAIDNNLKNILNLVLKSLTFQGYPYSDKPNLEASAKLARTAASDGMVLLRNEADTLPISTDTRLAVFGNGAYDLIIGGTGSGDVNEAYTTSLLSGLTQQSVQFDEVLSERYASYINSEKAKQTPLPLPIFSHPPIIEMTIEDKQLTQAAQSADAALITISRNSGEFFDRKIEDDFLLRDDEQALITRVSDAFHRQNKRVVVVLNVGGVIETASWKDKVDAILLAWQPGQEAGSAIASVLSGAVNPSAKLPTSFAVNLQSYPSFQGFPGQVLEKAEKQEGLAALFGDAKAAEVIYHDGLNVGYRGLKSNQLVFPFGHGLSYTEFSYGDVTLEREESSQGYRIKVPITNIGRVSGREVVQLYVSMPDGRAKRVEFELKAFAKTRLLGSGETEVVELAIADSDLAYFDETQQDWQIETGTYRVFIGASSQDFRTKAAFTRR